MLLPLVPRQDVSLLLPYLAIKIQGIKLIEMVTTQAGGIQMQKGLTGYGPRLKLMGQLYHRFKTSFSICQEKYIIPL